MDLCMKDCQDYAGVWPTNSYTLCLQRLRVELDSVIVSMFSSWTPSLT